MPAGTLSGAPKIRAMEIIDELETVRHEACTAELPDMWTFTGDMDFCITIRTMIKKRRKRISSGRQPELSQIPFRKRNIRSVVTKPWHWQKHW